MVEAPVSHRAPCMLKPHTYAPSRLTESTLSCVSHLVTSVNVTNLSSSHWFFWAATWFTEVKNDWGLIKYDSHVHLGISIGLPAHSSNCPKRAVKFASHPESAFIDAHEILDHFGGTSSMNRASHTASMASDMLSSPLKPNVNSFKERTISANNRFMTSISCRNEFWKGPFSSNDASRSSMSNFFSPKRSMMSSSLAAATSVGDMPPPSSSPADRGCSSTSVLNMPSDCVVRKSISALGCNPKATGVSEVKVALMCFR